MVKLIIDYLASITLGDAQSYKNMAVFPLFTSLNHGPEYLTLKEALALGVLAITEISEGGSVPELKAINKGDLPILLLDGEELAGAKQNRVLNTTILLKEHSETIIPVSCTEQGRWSYRSSEFADSDVIMTQKLRYKNIQTVAHNLRSSREFRSNQGEVWDHVEEMQNEAGVRSSTRAMKDVYESRQDDLDEYLRAFPHLPHQRGILVFINGRATGLDMVSLESACAILNPKLVKSYAIDAHLEMRGKEKDYEISPDNALRFLKKASGCKEERYESIGHGIDYRFQGETIVGSALVYRDGEACMKNDSNFESETLNLELSLPFDRSYWVEPEKLLAGCYPGDKHHKEAEAKLGGLIVCGIKLVINLMEEDELGHDREPFVMYEKTLQRLAKEVGTEVECIRMPIQDLNTSRPEFMVTILDRIDQAILQAKPVFVHCWGGKGRTGTVVGCYLARHGKASGQDVLLKINELRKNDPTSHQRSPETERQRDMVKNWRKGK